MSFSNIGFPLPVRHPAAGRTDLIALERHVKYFFLTKERKPHNLVFRSLGRPGSAQRAEPCTSQGSPASPGSEQHATASRGATSPLKQRPVHRAPPSATATGFCPFLYIFKESFLYFEEETVPHLIRNANRAVPQSGREPGLLYRYKSNSFQSFPTLMRIQRALSKISYRERFIAGLFPARSYLPFGYSRQATRSNLKQL